MSRVWISVAIIFLTSVLCFQGIVFVNNTVTNITEAVDNIQNDVNNREFDKAIKSLNDVNDEWEKNYKIFALFIPHERLIDIDQYLKIAKVYLRYENSMGFSNEMENLKNNIEYLKESELVEIQNIL